jgi:CRP/FNR family transcriptional regulator, cyclic AMP receptor protein
MDPEPDIPLLLADLLPPWFARLRALSGGVVRHFDAGDVVLWEGEQPLGFWAVLGGAVTLAFTTPSGRRATVMVLGRGGVFGEQGLSPRVVSVRPGPISSSEVRALVPTAACSIGFSALRLAAVSDPRVARWIAAAVSRRASHVERALARSLLLRVPARLLGVLEELAIDHGCPGPGGVRIDLPLTQDLLASMVGATRESVNRALRQLELEGLVRRIGPRYFLPDRRLVSEAGLA